MNILKTIKKEVFDIKTAIDDGKDYISICTVYDNYSIKMIKYIESKRKSVLESLFNCIADNIKNNLPANELITVRIDEQLKNYIITKLTIIEKKQHINISNERKEIQYLFICLKIYSSLPNEQKTETFNKWNALYKDFDNIQESFDKLHLTKLYNLFCEIKSKLENKETRDTIYKTFNQHRGIIQYILFHIDEPFEKFTWRENQRLGWQKAIDSNFISGIHSQATGSGKSLIALKEINEYNKKYPTHNVMWICERKDIPQKLFFQDVVKRVNLVSGTPHKRNHKFWQINDIIDMSKYHVIEHIYNKDPKWVQNINTYTGNKPIFLIINRAFMTTKSHKKNIQYKYQEIVKMPKFVIIDECHSSMSNETYNLLLYLKNNCKSKIHGFSATPYRTGKSYTNINIKIDTDINIDTNENEQKLLNIFHEQEDKSKLNILSFFNLKDAIEEGIILEPVFHWYYIDKDDSKTADIYPVLRIIKSVLKKCKYKKCIVWCGTIALAEEWKTIFDEHKHKYTILKNLCSYIDHSRTKNNDYDNFYNEKDNCIMFCANKFREGSDIPYLSCCVFLDKVINRGLIPFIQCIGRVLRKDIENEKKNGIVLDGCIKDDNESNVKTIVLKILKYYEYLYDLSCDNENINTYNHIKSSIDVNPDTKIISIKLKNNKTLKIDVAKLQLSSLEWTKIIPTFTEQLKKKIILSDYQEYKVIQQFCQDINIQDKYHYEQEYINYPELCVEGTQMLDIKVKYSNYFKNWYNFLNIDTNCFIQQLDIWRQECKSRDITNFKQYMKLCRNYKQFPNMPEEFYEGFTNIESELHNKNKSVFL